jgi:hypothetical protein
MPGSLRSGEHTLTDEAQAQVASDDEDFADLFRSERGGN